MTTSTNKITQEEKHQFTSTWDVKTFAIKAAIALVFILVLANLLLPDMKGLKQLESPKAKLIMLSFIQNPRVLLKMSEIDEEEGKLDNAIREIEVAIGLLEMHGANKQIIQQYFDRLNKLKSINADSSSAQKG